MRKWVVVSNGTPQSIGPDGEYLAFSKEPTKFNSIYAANIAATRTLEYAMVNGYEQWGFFHHGYSIIPVEE